MNLRIPSQKGSTLFVVLFFVAILSVFVGAAFNYTSETASLSQRSIQLTMGYGVADAAMELVYTRWRSIAKTNSHTSLGAVAFIDPTNASNRTAISGGKDITLVSLRDLGIPGGYLGLPTDDTVPIGQISIKTVDVYGRAYGSYDSAGRCLDTSYVIDTSDPRTGSVYPPVATPDYAFLTTDVSANGFNSVNLIYEVSVNIPVQVRGGVLNTGVKRLFKKSFASAAQAAIFYENRLEIIPGTNYTVNGRVQTNDDLWVAKVGGATALSFLENVTYAGDYQNGAIPLKWEESTTTYSGINENSFTNGRNQGSVMNVGGVNRDYLSADNPNGSSLRETIEIPVRRDASATDLRSGNPETTDFNTYWKTDANADQAAIEAARIYNTASLKILIAYNPDGTIDAANTIVRKQRDIGSNYADGAEVSPTVKSAILSQVVNPSNGGSRISVQDQRERGDGATTSAAVAATEIKMGSLKTLIESTPEIKDQFNGVVYVADITQYQAGTGNYGTEGALSVKHGILLSNAEQLPASSAENSFTLATQNGVIIQGNYNTGGSNTGTNPDSNDQNIVNGSTNVPGYTQVTSAILADAVAVVSNNFKPDKGFSDLNQYARDTNGKILSTDGTVLPALVPTSGPIPVPGYDRGAINTTVNTGIVSGNYLSDANGFSGGAPNLIRFLENWNTLSAADLVPGAPYFDATYGDYNGSGTDRRKFTYNGSIMQSFQSKDWTARWKDPNAYPSYDPPSRTVLFDKSFLSKPPLGFPGAYSFAKGAWSRL